MTDTNEDMAREMKAELDAEFGGDEDCGSWFDPNGEIPTGPATTHGPDRADVLNRLHRVIERTANQPHCDLRAAIALMAIRYGDAVRVTEDRTISIPSFQLAMNAESRRFAAIQRLTTVLATQS